MKEKWLRERDELFTNPTLEGAVKFYEKFGNVDWARPDVPLAALHKARLQWLDATDIMIAESLKWLKDHKYENTFQGAPPLTPEKRDADRVTIGKKPLREQ